MLGKGNVAFTLRWNWAHVLLLVLVWSYGFEDTGFRHAPLKTLLMLGFLIWAIAVYRNVGEKYRDLYRDELTCSVADVWCLVLYLVLLSGFVFAFAYRFEISLTGDQLHHAQSSQSQAIALSKWLIDKTALSLPLEYKALLRLVNAALLALLVAFYVYVRRSAAEDRVALIVLVLLILKLGPDYSDIHPPFRLFPLWLSSIVLGLNDFAFRFVSIVALSLCGFTLYSFSENHLGKLNAFLCGLAVATIPLLSHVGAVVEQSIWVTLAWSYILIAMRESTRSMNYVRIVSVISIASLMRAPGFVALVPVFLLMGIEHFRRQDFTGLKKYLVWLAPAMVLLPFLAVQFLQGTPATAGETTSFAKLAASVDGGLSLRVMYENIQVPWVAFLPFCVLAKQGQWHKSVLILVFFFAAYYVFYSIRPVLWGAPRYQAELWLPFVILGFFNVVSMLGRARFNNALLTLGLALLPLVNATSLARLEATNRPVDAWGDYFDEVKSGGVKIWPEGVYNIRGALHELREAGYSANSCKVGRVHETFSEVLSGYTLREMAAVWNRIPVCSRLSAANLHTLGRDIKLILFVDGPYKERQIQLLLESGQWQRWREFRNDTYGSTIIGLIRK